MPWVNGRYVLPDDRWDKVRRTPTAQPVSTEPIPPAASVPGSDLAEKLRAALGIGQPYTGLAPQIPTVLPGDIAPTSLPPVGTVSGPSIPTAPTIPKSVVPKPTAPTTVTPAVPAGAPYDPESGLSEEEWRKMYPVQAATRQLSPLETQFSRGVAGGLGVLGAPQVREEIKQLEAPKTLGEKIARGAGWFLGAIPKYAALAFVTGPAVKAAGPVAHALGKVIAPQAAAQIVGGAASLGAKAGISTILEAALAEEPPSPEKLALDTLISVGAGALAGGAIGATQAYVVPAVKQKVLDIWWRYFRKAPTAEYVGPVDFTSQEVNAVRRAVAQKVAVVEGSSGYDQLLKGGYREIDLQTPKFPVEVGVGTSSKSGPAVFKLLQGPADERIWVIPKTSPIAQFVGVPEVVAPAAPAPAPAPVATPAGVPAPIVTQPAVTPMPAATPAPAAVTPIPTPTPAPTAVPVSARPEAVTRPAPVAPPVAPVAAPLAESVVPTPIVAQGVQQATPAQRAGVAVDPEMRIILNPERSGSVIVLFSERQSDDVISRIRDAGFRWNREFKYWYAPFKPDTAALAQELAGGMDFEWMDPTTGEVDYETPISPRAARMKAELGKWTSSAVPASTVAPTPAVAPTVQPEAAPAAKEPWQMTKREWLDIIAAKRPARTTGEYTGVLDSAARGGDDAARRLSGRLKQLERDLAAVGEGSQQRRSRANARREQLLQEAERWFRSGYERGKDAKDQHYFAVRDALFEGKPVPPEVLAEYPGLKPTAPAEGAGVAAPTPQAIAQQEIAAGQAEVAKLPAGVPENFILQHHLGRTYLRPKVAEGLAEFIRRRDGREAIVVVDPTDKRLRQVYAAPLPESKPSLAATEQRLAEAVNVTIGEAELPIGGSLKIVQGPVEAQARFAGAEAKARFAFSDPELERIHQEAHGVKPEGLRERLGDIADEVYRRATREFEFLPRTPEFQRLRFALNQLKKQKGIQSAKTVDILRGVLVEMRKNPVAYDLFERKVLLNDLQEEALLGHVLPNKWTPEGIGAEGARIEAAMKAYPEVARALAERKDTWTSLKSEYSAAQKAAGFDVEGRFTREDYFRHQVLDHAQYRETRGIGKRLRTPTGRSFLQKREGGDYLMNTNYLEAEYEVMHQMLYDIQVAKVIKLVDDEYSVHRELKERAKQLSAERGKPVDWRTLLPEGYKLWQAREGNVFYLANTISERLAMGIAEGTLDAAGLSIDQIKSALAMGGKRTELAVKAEVADTLDNMGRAVTGHLTRAIRGAVGIWKEWNLISPPRYLKYNFRNVSGDAEAAALGNPAVFKKVPQAVKELAAYMFRHKVPTGQLAKFVEFGGPASTQQVAELKDINQLKVFAEILARRSEGIGERVVKAPGRALKGYWRTARLTTDFRELILRYAAFLTFREQMLQNNGVPTSWGASDPDLVMALPDIDQRAFMMSNQLCGAYDEVSVMTQNLRQGLMPFFSFKEVNAKRYIQLMKNVNLDVKATTALGKKVTIGLKRSPFLVWKAGKFALRVVMAWGVLQAYNLARFPDEERDLPDDVRRRPHIILGRDENGQVRYFDRLGILREFTEWFVDDDAEEAVQDWLNGKATLYEAARALVTGWPRAMFNQAIQALGPLKTAVEAGVGKSYYPNVFEPSTIRDKGAFLAQSLSLGDLYSAVMGLPQRSWTDILERMVYYKADPGESAYWDVRDDVRKFQEKIGKASYYGGTLSPRSSALYNLKLSLRYGDKTAAEKYLTEYYVLGGTDQGLKTSLESMHPLSGLSQAEQAAFLYDLLPDSAQRKLAPQLKGAKLADALTLIVQALPDETHNRIRLALQFYEQALFGKPETTETTPQ